MDFAISLLVNLEVLEVVCIASVTGELAIGSLEWLGAAILVVLCSCVAEIVSLPSMVVEGGNGWMSCPLRVLVLERPPPPPPPPPPQPLLQPRVLVCRREVFLEVGSAVIVDKTSWLEVDGDVVLRSLNLVRGFLPYPLLQLPVLVRRRVYMVVGMCTIALTCRTLDIPHRDTRKKEREKKRKDVR